MRHRARKTVRAIDPHPPVRSCLGCRRRRPQPELVRVTRVRAGDALPTLVVDGPSSGRGAWLCRGDGGELLVDPTCLDTALTRRQFGRAWRSTLDDDDVEAIRAALRHDEEPAD